MNEEIKAGLDFFRVKYSLDEQHYNFFVKLEDYIKELITEKEHSQMKYESLQSEVNSLCTMY